MGCPLSFCSGRIAFAVFRKRKLVLGAVDSCQGLPEFDGFRVMRFSASFELLKLLSENWRIHRNHLSVVAVVKTVRHLATSMAWSDIHPLAQQTLKYTKRDAPDGVSLQFCYGEPACQTLSATAISLRCASFRPLRRALIQSGGRSSDRRSWEDYPFRSTFSIIFGKDDV